MKNNLVSLEMTLQWEDECAQHTCKQYFAKANLWRDILPAAMMDAFVKPQVDAEVCRKLSAGELFGRYDPRLRLTVKAAQFNSEPRPGLRIIPRIGRFYPRNFVRNQPEISSDDNRPMRVVAVDEESLNIDLNMPLADHAVTVSARVDKLLPPAQEHGGRCNDFIYDVLQSGVGMQSSMKHTETDFFADAPFKRADENDDARFYRKPRLVHHLDDLARQHVENVYRRHLRTGMHVLDLMSSWVSHLPEIPDLRVTGLGMNKHELRQNTVLNQFIVHDLNRCASLSLDEESLDLAVCTASIEYLVKPMEVFAEVARCLKPGGKFVVTFSDRWFPPKAIRLWSELHAFERVALIIEYFKCSGLYKNMETLTIQHYPRPESDKYSGQLPYSDPVFSVWGEVQR